MRAQARRYEPLPAPFAEALRDLHPAKGHTPSREFRTVLAHARAQGWSLRAMGDVLGMSGERVRQLAPKQIPAVAELLPIVVPAAPVPEVKPRPEPRPPAKCGTLGGLKRHQRKREKTCDSCREAWRVYVAEQREKRDPADAPVHGKESTYANWKCRCGPCKAAHSVVMAKRKRGARR